MDFCITISGKVGDLKTQVPIDPPPGEYRVAVLKVCGAKLPSPLIITANFVEQSFFNQQSLQLLGVFEPNKYNQPFYAKVNNSQPSTLIINVFNRKLEQVTSKSLLVLLHFQKIQ